jgi:hypothetical protein
MSDALTDGLRGVAPDPTDATVALDPTASTRMLGDATDATAATRAAPRNSARPAQRTRRPLEPLDEPPRRRPPARAQAAAPARRRKRNPFRAVFALVLLLGVIVLGVLAYQLVQDSTHKAVQLRENVRGGVQDAVDQLKGLVEDNTQ